MVARWQPRNPILLQQSSSGQKVESKDDDNNSNTDTYFFKKFEQSMVQWEREENEKKCMQELKSCLCQLMETFYVPLDGNGILWPIECCK